MKSITIVISFVLNLPLYIFGQNTDYHNYLREKSFFNQLSPDLINYYANTYLIKSITEIRSKLDRYGAPLDSSILNRYYFDELGQLIEKQFFFNEEGDRYFSYKYIYSEDNTKVDSVFTSLWGNISLLDSGKYSQNPKTECKVFDKKNRLQSVEVAFENEEYKYLNIYYDYNTYGLLKLANIESDKGDYQHEIVYEYYSKFRH